VSKKDWTMGSGFNATGGEWVGGWMGGLCYHCYHWCVVVGVSERVGGLCYHCYHAIIIGGCVGVGVSERVGWMGELYQWGGVGRFLSMDVSDVKSAIRARKIVRGFNCRVGFPKFWPLDVSPPTQPSLPTHTPTHKHLPPDRITSRIASSFDGETLKLKLVVSPTPSPTPSCM
jgi:hypothetical protein